MALLSSALGSLPPAFLRRCLLGCLACLLAVVDSPAKEPPLTAIELYDGESGAAYAQVTDLLINGKSEMRVCPSADRIDRSSYGKLAKVSLSGATSLERTSDGVLMLNRGTETVCVLPSNLKFEKEGAMGASELADGAVLQGSILSSSPAGVTTPPPLKPGVKIVFVSQSDTELAEYLRGERASSIAGWNDYLLRYPNSVHAAAAKQSLASLYVKDGERELLAYGKSEGSSNVSSAALRQAWTKDQQALETVKTDAAGLKLRDDIHAELTTLINKGSAELELYRHALKAGTAGYKHLAAARELAAHVLDVDAQFEAGQRLQADVAKDASAVENALRTAEDYARGQRFDDALNAIDNYRAFADEEPRIASIVEGAFKYHLDRGKVAEDGQSWKDAVQEYQRAVDINKTPEAVASLKRAKVAYQVSSDKADANAALQQSEVFQAEKNFIGAYEVLANLKDGPRALVRDEMEDLVPAYVKSASQEAAKIEGAHLPIRGQNDEVELKRAYQYLQNASGLDDNADLKLKLQLLSKNLSDYYLGLAKRYLDKPMGSGVGMAWLYLDQAQYYQANRDDVLDERKKSQAIHSFRSTLSIRIAFKDPTLGKDTSGSFATQLSDAIAAGLEASDVHVKIVGPSDATAVEPNFQLIGTVLDHHLTVVPTTESLASKYRAGVQITQNPARGKANRDYETANAELQKAQKILEGAQAHGKKKEIADAKQQLADAEAKLQEAQRRRDSFPESVPIEIIEPYQYTKRTYDLSAAAEIAFRIVDGNGVDMVETTRIAKQAHTTVVVLENVKPEDTEGLKLQGTPPNEAQFMLDLDTQARDALIKEISQKIQSLPTKILAKAHQLAAAGDMDDAAEAYILYLNSTSDTEKAGREEATHFLYDKFHIAPVASSTS